MKNNISDDSKSNADNLTNNKDTFKNKMLGHITLVSVMQYFILLALVVCAIFSVAFALENKADSAVYARYEILDNDLIRTGVFIEGVNVGGLTKDQALIKLNDEYLDSARRGNRKITFMAKDYEKTYIIKDLGYDFDFNKSVREAYKVGRNGSKVDKILFANELANKREHIFPELIIRQDLLDKELKNIKDDVSNLGITMDVDKSSKMVIEAFRFDKADSILHIPVKG